jgi:restriction system protein
MRCGAVQYAQRVPQRIILINGSELARLMMDYGVGVRTDRTIEVNLIDLDYFEKPEE